jgi:hypothetical protein
MIKLRRRHPACDADYLQPCPSPRPLRTNHTFTHTPVWGLPSLASPRHPALTLGLSAPVDAPWPLVSAWTCAQHSSGRVCPPCLASQAAGRGGRRPQGRQPQVRRAVGEVGQKGRQVHGARRALSLHQQGKLPAHRISLPRSTAHPGLRGCITTVQQHARLTGSHASCDTCAAPTALHTPLPPGRLRALAAPAAGPRVQPRHGLPRPHAPRRA